MKQVSFVILLVALCAVTVGAQVGAPKAPFSIYAGGSMAVPNGPTEFSEMYKAGYNAFAGLGFKAFPKTQLIAKLEYNQFPFDPANVTGIDGGNTKIFMYGADARVSLAPPAFPLKPFAFIGGGMANMSFNEFSGSNTTLVTALNTQVDGWSENKPYFNVGAGFEFMSTPAFSLFLQGRYVSVSTTDAATTFVPFSLGLKFF
jgi:Outer membrane protein beta-barrel domain